LELLEVGVLLFELGIGKLVGGPFLGDLSFEISAAADEFAVLLVPI
jgi:hypothetical protein